MLTPEECKQEISQLIWDFQKARSILRESLSRSLDENDLGPTQELLDAMCRDLEPWLFSEEADQFMLRLTKKRKFTPYEMLNVMWWLGAKTKDPNRPRAGSSVSFQA